MMPVMDGFEVCQTLKKEERTSHIPILMLTAKATQADKLAGLSRGADAYLVKPFDKEELLLRLANFLKMTERIRELANSHPDSNDLPSPEKQFLEKVEAAIEAHLADPEFDTLRLLRELGMSRMQLHRKLKAITGFSTALFIRRYRLRRAKQLLETTDAPVSEIAWQTGFPNLSWFSQAFREAYGQPPSETRK